MVWCYGDCVTFCWLSDGGESVGEWSECSADQSASRVSRLCHETSRAPITVHIRQHRQPHIPVWCSYRLDPKHSFLTLHSVNLILFTLLLVHLILHISPHHSHHLRSHHLSLPRPINPDLKLISFTNPFLHSLLIPPGLPVWIFNLHWTKWAVPFVCFSFMC